MGLEAELVRVSRDTTESDLKLRREISGGTALWSDQVCLRNVLHRNVQRFRVFKTHRLCVSLNSRLDSNKEEEEVCLSLFGFTSLVSPAVFSSYTKVYSVIYDSGSAPE